MDAYIDQAVDIVIGGFLKSDLTFLLGMTLSDVERADLEILHLTRSLTTCLATFSTRFERALIIKAQQRNSLLPIYKLPTEVLIRIFRDYTNSERSPHSLTMVSTAWARIVLDSPTLWSHVDSSDTPQAVLTSLARSRDTPLDVTYTGSQYGDGDSPEDFRKLKLFIDAVGGQLHRWGSATLIMDYEPTLSGALMGYLIRNPTPLLEKLDIVGGAARYPLGFRWVDAFSQKVAPRLRHLELRDFLLSWDSSLLSRLHSLHVYGDQSYLGPTTSQMVQILKACPDLVHLVINCYMTEFEDETTIPIDFQPIELPDLKVFSLRLDPTGLQYILQVIHIPACASFHISGLLPTANIFSGDIVHLIPIFLPIIASANSIYIHLGARELRYEALAAEDSSPRVLFSVHLTHHSSTPEESYWSTLTWMLDHIHPPSLSIPVALWIKTPSLPLTQLFTQLRAYPVTSLSIIGNGIDEDNIIPYLTQPVMVDGTLRWRLPTLSELSFERCYDVTASEILSIVEGRLGLTASVLRHRIQVPPLRLTKLGLPRQMGGENAAYTAAVRKLRALVDHVEGRRRRRRRGGGGGGGVW